MDFDPIILRYEGLDAANQQVDLAQIGASLQGAAQLIGSAASIVATGRYIRRPAAMPVRILAGIPREGSWEIPAIIQSTVGAVSQYGLFAEVGKQLATRVTTLIVNTVVGHSDHGPKMTDDSKMNETLQMALSEVGQTSRFAIDAVTRMYEQQRPAVRALVAPIGISCATLQVGEMANGAFPIGSDVRAAIDAPVELEVQASRQHEILISEMDRVNQTCKFAFRGDEGLERRITGEITDPIIQTPNDPYSAAFSAQRWITVVGKLQLKRGEADKLYISDIVI